MALHTHVPLSRKSHNPEFLGEVWAPYDDFANGPRPQRRSVTFW